ncbi:MAG TPA: tetratricopeptide repeat protein [Pyrinomonadaceae bacterium]|nr:tetratricopeptide repeat protein [Pyrinomonadaceae bacterium]
MRSTCATIFVCLALSLAGCGSKPAPPAQATGQTASADSTQPVGDGVALEEEEAPPEELTPEQVEARKLFDQGRELARKDEDEKAAELYLQALKLDPEFAEAHLRLAMSYEVMSKKDEAEGEYKKAADVYQKYVRRHPKDARAHYNMGMAYNSLHKPDEAVRALRQAVKLDPENSDSQYEFGIALGKAAQYQESVLALQKATELDPDNFRAQEALEKAKINLQRWQAMVKQQEIIAKRQGAKNANANSTNASANTGTSPAPSPEAH